MTTSDHSDVIKFKENSINISLSDITYKSKNILRNFHYHLQIYAEISIKTYFRMGKPRQRWFVTIHEELIDTLEFNPTCNESKHIKLIKIHKFHFYEIYHFIKNSKFLKIYQRPLNLVISHIDKLTVMIYIHHIDRNMVVFDLLNLLQMSIVVYLNRYCTK